MQIVPAFIRKGVDRVRYRRLFALRRLGRGFNESYFSNLADTLVENRIARKAFRDIEDQLRGLDSTAWTFIKREAAPYVVARDEKRGWTQLFTILNQANAYNHLARFGCKNIRFVARSRVSTPDLEATHGSTKVLCEVKTINISDDEVRARTDYSARNIVLSLSDEFFDKFQSDCKQAAQQMNTYCPGSDVKKIVYLVINFDDILHEYSANYSLQIEKYVVDHPLPNMEVVVDSKPAYYYATA